MRGHRGRRPPRGLEPDGPSGAAKLRPGSLGPRRGQPAVSQRADSALPGPPAQDIHPQRGPDHAPARLFPPLPWPPGLLSPGSGPTQGRAIPVAGRHTQDRVHRRAGQFRRRQGAGGGTGRSPCPRQAGRAHGQRPWARRSRRTNGRASSPSRRGPPPWISAWTAQASRCSPWRPPGVRGGTPTAAPARAKRKSSPSGRPRRGIPRHSGRCVIRVRCATRRRSRARRGATRIPWPRHSCNACSV